MFNGLTISVQLADCGSKNVFIAAVITPPSWKQPSRRCAMRAPSFLDVKLRTSASRGMRSKYGTLLCFPSYLSSYSS